MRRIATRQHRTQAVRAELLAGSEGISSRPVRRIVLLGD
jgi:hypothetical protein